MTLWLFSHADTDGWRVHELVRDMVLGESDITKTTKLTLLPIKAMFFPEYHEWADAFDLMTSFYEIGGDFREKDIVIFADLGPCVKRDMDVIIDVNKIVKKVLVIEGFNHCSIKKYIPILKKANVKVFYSTPRDGKNNSYGHEAFECFRIYRKEIKEELEEFIKSLPSRKYRI